jgi:hypothetical protein
MSSTNVQIADNHHKANIAFTNSESGLEAIRYWLNRVIIPNSTSSSEHLSTILSSLRNDLATNNISNIVVNSDGSISPVTLDTTNSNLFSAQIEMHPSNPDILLASVTGNHHEFIRTLQVNFDVNFIMPQIFDYGLATKGPVLFDGNPTIEGVNNNNDADIYIESQNNDDSLQINGNTNFDGDVEIGNINGTAVFDGDVLIAGDQGQTAIDNHVFIGADSVEFPTLNTEQFRQYTNGLSINSSTDISDSMTLTNRVIEAGTNPYFLGNVIIEGVLFIESPNIIQFGGNVEIRGMIVGDGDVNNPGTNSMTFYGNFQSGTVPSGSEFDDMRSETGTSLLAPGFAVELAGNFSTVGGTIAVSGFHLSGNANALIKGSIINYSESSTIVEGNAFLRFDRSDYTKIPAGFNSSKILEYDASSWSMRL